MAYIVPTDLSQLALSGAHRGELETLGHLKAALSRAYTVYHGVHWTRSYASATVFGESDFVIVNRAGDVLVIEQKNGALEETPEGVVKHYGDGSKNVAGQVRRAVDTIKEKFRWIHGARPRLKVDYLIYLPDHRISDLNAAGIDSTRIIDASRRDRLAESIEGLLPAGTESNSDWVESVHRFFRQTFEIVPDVHAHVSSQERAFTRLSGGLADILKNLEMNPLRLRVRGCAGCGKTVLAARFYQEVLARDARPLLVCFNRPLREKLNGIVGGEGLVQTWYGLCAKFLEARGHDIDYTRMGRDPNFWPELQERVIGEKVPEDWRFDALIVDEGQDFEPEWFQILRLFLNERHQVLWLEDADQNIRETEASELADFVIYHARVNHRSPESVAHFIRKTLPFRVEFANDLPGLGVGVHPYREVERQPAVVAEVMTGLVKRGFNPDEVVIVTMLGHRDSVFGREGFERVGGFTLRRFTETYDSFGNQIMSPGQVRFESIRRFKGQQAPAVILVDVDPGREQAEHWNRLLYCGMTRATVRLELVVRDDNPRTDRFFAAAPT